MFDDGTLDKLAREYEEGTWSGHGKASLGRVRLYDEDMEAISFPITEVTHRRHRSPSIDRLAKNRGQRKSDFFREAIGWT